MAGSIYSQILDLLTTSPGNLVYHLILVFSIAGALPGAISIWLKVLPVEGRRMVFGLIGLLLIQVFPVIFSVQIQPGSISNYWMPVIDRSVSTLSLVLMIWLWAFPAGARSADLGTILLGALSLTLTVFAGLWASNLLPNETFNASLGDGWWNLFSIALALMGGGLLLIRRPPGYENGLALFSLLFIGHLLHYFWPFPPGDYAGNVRLAQIAAFPLLLTLPWRFSLTEINLPGRRLNEKPAAGIERDFFRHILALTSWKSMAEIYRALSAAVAHAMRADLCLVMTPPDTNKVISILSGYDRGKSQFLGTATFDGSLVPVLAEALRQSRPLHLPADSHIPDLTGLEKILDLPLAGALLAAPLSSDSRNSQPGVPAVVLITPYSRRAWTPADQHYLAEIVPALAEILRRAQETRDLQERLSLTQRSLQALQQEYDRLSRTLKARSDRPSPAPPQLARDRSLLKEEIQDAVVDEQQSARLEDRASMEGDRFNGSGAGEGSEAKLINVNDLLKEALAGLEDQLRDRNLQLIVEIQEGLPAAKFDGNLLLDFIKQFLLNAITVSPDQTMISLRTHLKDTPEERGFIHIQIRDSGQRIELHDLESLLAKHPFDLQPLGDAQGDFTSLLISAKNFMEAHQGKLWLDAESGEGNIVNLLIPILESTDPKSGTGAED